VGAVAVSRVKTGSGALLPSGCSPMDLSAGGERCHPSLSLFHGGVSGQLGEQLIVHNMLIWAFGAATFTQGHEQGNPDARDKEESLRVRYSETALSPIRSSSSNVSQWHERSEDHHDKDRSDHQTEQTR